MGTALFVFCNLYPNFEIANIGRFQRILVKTSIIFGSIMAFIGFAGGYVDKVEIIDKTINPEFTSVFTIYFIYILLILLGTLFFLTKTYLKGDNKIKADINPLFKGLIFSIIIVVITNLILVAIFNYSGLVSVGPLSVVVFIFYTTKAILQRQILGTRVLIGKIMYQLLLSLMVYIAFYFFSGVALTISGSIYHPISYLLGIPFSIIFSLIFNELNNFVKKQVRTAFINPGYDPYEVVDSLGRDIALTLNLQEVVEVTITVISRTIRPRFQEIVIINSQNDKTNYILFTDKQAKQIVAENYSNCRLIWDKINLAPIIINEEGEFNALLYKDLTNWIIPITKQMLKDEVRAIIPIGALNKIVGMIMLGSKEADSAYTIQDIELLTSIANTAGLATARSLFYEEVNDLNSSLKEKIDTATSKLTTQNTNLEIALTRIQKLRQREQDMLDILGHELRTPITIVRNALAFLKSDFTPDSYIDPIRLGSYIDKALEASKRELIIIETLLSATKIDANRVQMSLDKINMIDVIKISIEAQANFAKEKNIEIRFVVPQEGDWFIYADNTRTQEIQDNFVSNAVKYTLKGYVQIKLRKITDSVTNQKFIEVSVEDSGIGIPKDDLKRLGGKFFRARQYIKEGDHDAVVVRSGGTGLGLYVSFELVRIMGGNIDIKSEIGKGSTFIYTLPEYIGQTKKFIDQTFDGDDRLAENKSTTDIIERTKRMIEVDNDDNDQADITSAKAAGFYKLTTANDVIKKINEGKKYLEGESTNHIDLD